MVKIAILTNYPFPGFAATANRIRSFAKELSGIHNAKVFVVCPGFDINNSYKESNKYEIVNIYQKKMKHSNLFIRALKEISFIYKINTKLGDIKPDIIIPTIPSIFFIIFSLYNLSTVKVIVDIRDLSWEYLIRKGGIIKYFGIFYKRFLKILIKHVSYVLVTNDAEYNNIKKYCRNIDIIRNGISIERFNRLKKNSNYNNNNVKQKKITYAGNIGIAQELDIIIDVIKDMKNYSLTLIGAGEDYNRLNNYIVNNNISNVTMTGILSWEELIQYYKESNYLYLPLGEAFRSAVPSKIYEYISASKILILGVPNGPASDFADKFEGVLLVKPSDRTELKNILVKYDNEIINPNFEKNLEIIEKNFLREKQSIKLVKIINDILIQTKSSSRL